jgi:NAD(P)-dependent dehydrogenase (short-subunit alcohol dehydrogenase family)
MPTWLITGCSTGLGRELATTVLEHGESVVLTARNPAAIEDLAKSYPDTSLALTLDVTDHAQRSAAVDSALERFGGIDVLVNNAAPARAAEAILAAVRSPTPPRLLVLGPDALGWFDHSVEELSADVDRWRPTGLGTSFPEGS